jgi:DNA-binding transcriptional MerR regulator
MESAMVNLQQPNFLQSEVLEVTGLDAPTLQTWVNRKIVCPASDHPGRSYGHGGRRMYSGEDIIWLAILKHLTDWGLPIGKAVAVCTFDVVRDDLRQRDAVSDYVLHGLMTIAIDDPRNLNRTPINNMPVTIRASEDELEQKLRKEFTSRGQGALVVPTGRIAAATIARLETLAGANG